jgi:hypothetical protein
MDLSSAADLRRRISSMRRVEIDPLSNKPVEAASDANSSGKSNSSVILISLIINARNSGLGKYSRLGMATL